MALKSYYIFLQENIAILILLFSDIYIFFKLEKWLDWIVAYSMSP